MSASRTYPVFVRGEDEVAKSEEVFHKVWSALGCSRSDAILYVWEEALNKILDSDLIKDFDPKRKAIYKAAREARRLKADDNELTIIYETLATEEFAEWAKENAIDTFEFLERYAQTHPDQTDRIKTGPEWLEYFLADGKPHSTSDVRSAAVNTGIAQTDSDWNNLKRTASRKGYVVAKGVWQKREDA